MAHEFRTDECCGIQSVSDDGCVARSLALLERLHVYPGFFINGQAPHPQAHLTKYGCVSEVVAPGGLSREAFDSTGYETETEHVHGKTNVVVVGERSEVLVDVGGNVRVVVLVEHQGGHFVPTKLEKAAMERQRFERDA